MGSLGRSLLTWTALGGCLCIQLFCVLALLLFIPFDEVGSQPRTATKAVVWTLFFGAALVQWALWRKRWRKRPG